VEKPEDKKRLRSRITVKLTPGKFGVLDYKLGNSIARGGPKWELMGTIGGFREKRMR